MLATNALHKNLKSLESQRATYRTTSQQRFVQSGGAPSLTPTSTTNDLPISMLQTAPPPHAIKLSSFIHQAHFPVKVSFINVSHMGFDSGLSIPRYGAFLLAVDHCRLLCHHHCWRLFPRTSLIIYMNLMFP